MDYSEYLLLDNLAVLTIVSSIFVLMLAFIYVIGLSCCSYCFCFKRKKKDTLNPLAYLKNMDLVKKNLEDNFYFSEIISSSGNGCSAGGSLVSMRSDSTVSVISETSSNFELLPVVNSVVSSCVEVHKSSGSVTLPTVTVGVKFLPFGDKSKECGKLFVIIKDVQSLPSKDYPRHAEIYMTLNVLRNSKMFVSSLKKDVNNIVYANRSRSFRNTGRITLNEHFVIDGQKTELQKWSIRVTAFEHDMYTDSTELASSMTSLSNIYKQIIANTEGTEITLTLKPVQKALGNLLVGLSYLPTSQRLTVSIVKASNLTQFSADKDDVKNFHPYAQLFLLTGVTGRQLKKKRLFFEKSTDTYDFNSTVSFDVVPSQLETITLLIVLYNKNVDNIATTTTHRTSDIEKVADDRYLGRVALGNLVTGVKEKKHWRMMLSVPRRVVTVWHTLK